MALNNFKPTVWTARILVNLQKALVFGQEGVINRDYEGEISRFGDSVKINSIGPVTVGTYSSGSDINTPQDLADGSQMLLIDQQKYFNFIVDDVDRAQQNPRVMDAAMREAGYALKDTLDQFLAAKWGEAGSNIGTNASPKSDLGTAGKPYEYLLNLGTLLKEKNVPSDGRWVIVPPWFTELMLRDTRFVNAGTPQSEERMANARVMRAAGFMILESNNVVNTADDNYKILAGHSMAWTLAEQIVSVEAFRPERRFGDAVKGLHVYGAKVVRPAALACLHADRP